LGANLNPLKNNSKIEIEKIFYNFIKEDSAHSRLREDTLLYLSMMKKHDPDTYFHEIRVSLISVFLAREFSYLDIRPELYGGANHDVGKIEISNRLLHKEKFRDADYKIIENHAKDATR